MKIRTAAHGKRGGQRRIALRAVVSLCGALAAGANDFPDSFPETRFAQAGSQDAGTTYAQSVTTRIGTNRVSITISGGERVISGNGLPDHTPGRFPNRGNPNMISAQNYNFHLPLKPQAAARPRPANGAWFGVALNGVPFEPGTAEFWNDQREWNYEARSGFIDLGLDEHNAHVQPTGAYHYHGLPVGLMMRLGGDVTQMLLVGYAADGFPIYTSRGYTIANDSNSPLRTLRSSYRLKTGERAGGPGGQTDGKFTSDYEYVKGSGDLDECNGRLGVTPEFPEGTYHYYLTDEFPWIARFWHGTPDASFMKRGPSPGGPRPSGQGGPGQRPPSAGPGNEGAHLVNPGRKSAAQFIQTSSCRSV